MRIIQLLAKLLKLEKLLHMCETLLHFAATDPGLPGDVAEGNSEATQDFLPVAIVR